MDCDPKNICIRVASLEDFDRVFNNEQVCYDVPWSAKSLQDCFKDGYTFYVMEYRAQIIGHMIVQWVLDEAHLHNVCVTPQFQLNGLGKLWMSQLLKIAKIKNCSVIFLEVRKSNAKAIRLYSALGFVQIGERKNYYQTKQGKENGLVMELRANSGNFDCSSFD